MVKQARPGDSEARLAWNSVSTTEFDDAMNTAINFLYSNSLILDQAAAYFDRDNVGLPGVALYAKVRWRALVVIITCANCNPPFINRRLRLWIAAILHGVTLTSTTSGVQLPRLVLWGHPPWNFMLSITLMFCRFTARLWLQSRCGGCACVADVYAATLPCNVYIP